MAEAGSSWEGGRGVGLWQGEPHRGAASPLGSLLPRTATGPLGTVIK